MTKLEKHEKRCKKNWSHFGLTRRGRMSWADWFTRQYLMRRKYRYRAS